MIGSHLCERMLRDGHAVVCLDNLSTGRMANLEHLAGHPQFALIPHDIVHDLPALPQVDRVYHLASPASPVGYTRLPIETMRANSEGTRRLIELALSHRARFLFCSTSEVYGDPLQHPQCEEYRGNVSPIGPRAMYDESKRFGEAITMAYVRTFGLDGRIVRIFNTYGPHSDPGDGRLVVNLIVQALRRDALTIYGDGAQTRSMCFVNDLVEGLILTMESERARGEVINLGKPEEYTVLEIAEMIRRLTGSDSPLVFTAPAVGDDPRMRRPNIDKARALLGWEPRTPLIEGLCATISDFRVALNGHSSAASLNGHSSHAALNGHPGPAADSSPEPGQATMPVTSDGAVVPVRASSLPASTRRRQSSRNGH